MISKSMLSNLLHLLTMNKHSQVDGNSPLAYDSKERKVATTII